MCAARNSWEAAGKCNQVCFKLTRESCMNSWPTEETSANLNVPKSSKVFKALLGHWMVSAQVVWKEHAHAMPGRPSIRWEHQICDLDFSIQWDWLSSVVCNPNQRNDFKILSCFAQQKDIPLSERFHLTMLVRAPNVVLKLPDFFM